MPDRDKVIKDLEFCVNGHFKVELSLATKVLALLKEQEAQKFFVDESGKITPLPVVVRCKDCRYGQYCTEGETTYQCFKWNSNEFGALHEQDWFCADGER